MNIGSRQIGPGHPPYVIAEVGVNHDGSPGRARELIELAAQAGADAVKLQLFRTDQLLSRAARPAVYQAAAGEHDPVAMLRRLELSIDQMAPLVERAHALGLHAIVTIFSVPLVREAERLPWDAYKTASPDIIHRPLLESLAATGRPMIVSTGAAEASEVERAVGWLRACWGRMAILQCVSAYPTEPRDAAIGGVSALRGIAGFPGPIGYSDHTPQADTGGLAATIGAEILEKHLTYDRAAPGPDHAASLGPAEFRAYAAMARDEGAMRASASGRVPLSDDPRYGPIRKRVLDCERDVRRVSRQSVTTTRPLPAGHVLGESDLTIKRPGTGIEPWRLTELIGRRVARGVDANMPVMEGDLA
jgi:N,N'-diacetyllegionaminate synthase